MRQVALAAIQPFHDTPHRSEESAGNLHCNTPVRRPERPSPPPWSLLFQSPGVAVSLR